jgi:MFS family permease
MSSLTGKDEFGMGNEELRVGEDSPPPEVAKDELTLVALDRHGRPVFFRSTLFQILVVGVCAFTAPGIWSAMNGLGVGGSLSPDLVNGANAILYAFMTVTCFAGPWMTNLIGFRTLAMGSLGYLLYAAGLYVNNRYGTTWFVYVGAVACGISAGFFWSVDGAISTGYPEQRKRGRYLATGLPLETSEI